MWVSALLKQKFVVSILGRAMCCWLRKWPSPSISLWNLSYKICDLACSSNLHKYVCIVSLYNFIHKASCWSKLMQYICMFVFHTVLMNLTSIAPSFERLKPVSYKSRVCVILNLDLRKAYLGNGCGYFRKPCN